MIKYITCFFVLPVVALAAPLPDFTFKSPAFNGNGYGSYELQLENTQYVRQQAIQQALEAAKQQAQQSAQNTPLNQFLANLQSRIYAEISQNLATSMFQAGTATSGSFTFQGNTIFWQNLGSNINLVVTDNLGNSTAITVPLGSFTFTQPTSGTGQ
jgi:Type VIII secretion system (T8SS), CsgF protein